MQQTSNEPVWREALAGSQMLLVAFGALVLMPLITGMDPNVALFTAGVGTLRSDSDFPRLVVRLYRAYHCLQSPVWH